MKQHVQQLDEGKDRSQLTGQKRKSDHLQEETLQPQLQREKGLSRHHSRAPLPPACYPTPNSTINTIQQTKKEKVKNRIERLRIVTCREEEREWDAGNKTGRFLIAPRIMRVVAIVSVRTQSRGDNNNNDGWC